MDNLKVGSGQWITSFDVMKDYVTSLEQKASKWSTGTTYGRAVREDRSAARQGRNGWKRGSENIQGNSVGVSDAELAFPSVRWSSNG